MKCVSRAVLSVRTNIILNMFNRQFLTVYVQYFLACLLDPIFMCSILNILIVLLQKCCLKFLLSRKAFLISMPVHLLDTVIFALIKQIFSCVLSMIPCHKAYTNSREEIHVEPGLGLRILPFP